MSDFTVNVQNGVCHISISRPSKRNTIDASSCLSWVQLFAQAQKDENVHCVVLSGENGIFCAGADLNEMLHRTDEIQQAYQSLVEAMIAFDKPVLAAVQGPAVGLGVAILCYSDMVYCGEKSLFSVPFTALGLSPEFGLTYCLCEKAGSKKAMEKLLLSEPISAQEALQMGIVTSVFKDEDVLKETLARAARLTKLPLGSLRGTKVLLRHHQGQAIREAMKAEEAILLERLQSDEAREACSAFEEGRKPDFSACSH